LDYARGVHRALGGYERLIDELIAECDRAAARMRFRGTHRAEFLGVPATGSQVSWSGAAFFRVSDERIAELWVLGDLDGLRAQLAAASR
ncbi:MAG: ester cyclase, partial [Pseudomonadota bacterium]